MKKKLLLIIPAVIIFMAIAFFAGIYFYRHTNNPVAPKPQEPKVYNIYEQPSAKKTISFPADHPQFTAEVSTVKTKSIDQTSILVYQFGDKKKTPVFKRHFYDDVFHGANLTYSIASDAASFSQTGMLASFGCKEDACQFPWTNFYSWDDTQKQFGIDNIAHQDFFKVLLNTYQTMDQRGCDLAGDAALPEQKGMSFTELYKKYPNLTSYCSKDTKLVTFSELYYFLETEKIVQEIVDGQNLSSRDIKDTDI
jgi:hypothetical protein